MSIQYYSTAEITISPKSFLLISLIKRCEITTAPDLTALLIHVYVTSIHGRSFYIIINYFLYHDHLILLKAFKTTIKMLIGKTLSNFGHLVKKGTFSVALTHYIGKNQRIAILEYAGRKALFYI